MKRVLALLAVVCLFATIAPAQKFSKAFSGGGSKRVVIEADKADLKIIGTSGNEVSIEADGEFEMPERAKGLKPLYRNASDNTGIGLEVTESGGVMTIRKATSKDAEYIIRIPADAALKIEEESWEGSEFEISDLKGEIEVKSLGSDIVIKNVTGPVTANTTSGDIIVVFSSVSQSAPTTISNISGFIDVTMPASTKATLRMESISGDIYTDFELSLKEKGMPRVGGSRISNTINGGGVEITLKAISDDIYLRKK
ncbi:MAG: DUF4097 family beta strand repeat-containing protein [Saprospiraceae bacterium]